LSKAEIESTMSAMMTAESETTATVLSGTTFLLLKHPRVLEKMVKEIRGRFKNVS
jgi:cytochrome P450